MSTCAHTPRKPKLYVTMVDASFTFTASGQARPLVFVEKNSMRNKLNDVYAFPDLI